MTDEDSDSPQVLIVGCGPVGLMTANLLGLYGVRTMIVDARDRLIDFPRGVGLDDEGLRTFQTAGLIDEVLPHTIPNQLMVFVDGKGRELAKMSPAGAEYGWPRRNGFVQPLADAVLLEGLSRFPHVDVRWGYKLAELKQDADSVLARFDVNEGNGATCDIQAQFLVGADGGSSQTRSLLGLKFDGTSSSTSWLVVDLSHDPIGQPGCYVGADPERPYVSISIPHGIRRFEFMLDPHEVEEATNERAFSERLMKKFIDRPEDTDIIRWRVYTHHSRLSEHFNVGHVFLAGDAAHLMPVWQGQGYNSGLRDALNLAWKLAAVVNGKCDAGLLETYESERRDHVTAMVNLSTLVGRFVSPRNKTVAAARNAGIRALGTIPSLKHYLTSMRFKPMPKFDRGALSTVGVVSGRSPVGRLFIQPRVRTTDRSNVLLDDVLGQGSALVVWNNNPRKILDQASQELLSRLNVRLVEIRPVQQMSWSNGATQPDIVIGDSDGKMQAWFEAHKESVVFVRPDHVVGGASRAQDASQMVRALAAAMCVLPSQSYFPVIP
jgi:3-(3-hydroxy-phenyl)propionate hydroxylase